MSATTTTTTTAATAAAPTAEEIAAIKAENATLKGTVDETKRAAQFWYEKANTAAPAPAKAKADEEDDEDVLDVITSKGAKGLEAMLSKRGFVRASDVDKTVEERASQIAREADLIDRYKELKDQKSDFFKATAAEYGQLVKSGVPKSMAMELAAQRVELDGIHSGSRKSRKQVEADEAAEKEQTRLARISAQSGTRGGGGSETEDEDLTPEQRRIAVSMLAGNGVSEDDAIAAYKKRAKAGVAMRGGR